MTRILVILTVDLGLGSNGTNIVPRSWVGGRRDRANLSAVE